MAVETIGDAFSLGWMVTVRCGYGRSESPSSRSSRECNYRKELDMETLVWTWVGRSRCRAWKAGYAARAADRAMWWCFISRRAVLSRANAYWRRWSRRLSSATDVDDH